MLILAFDTHGPHISVALCRGGTVIAEHFTHMARGQAEHLMAALEDTLSSAGFGYHDLDALAVGIGPGNFTGIRLGVSTARGLSLGLGIPCLGVSSFESLSAFAPDTTPVISGPKGHVYLMMGDTPKLLSEETAKATLGTQLIATGPNTFDDYPNRVIASHHPALGIAHVAAAAPERTRTEEAPTPLYVKAPDAAPPKITAPKIVA